MSDTLTVFEPALYSLEELAFFKAHIEEPPVVALAGALPPGVNPTAVREVLGRLYELQQLQTHKGFRWQGYKAILDSIDLFLETYARDRELQRRGAPAHTSMYSWDAKGRPHAYGVGSDSAIMRSRINEDGSRTKFAVRLEGDITPIGQMPWTPKEPEPLPVDLIEDTVKGFIQCPICGFAQNYQPDSQNSRNMARARVGKHMTSIVGPSADQHRELYTHIFGS